MAKFPHCDDLVLHAPGECQYCDRHPDWQQDRIDKGVNFTGHNDEGKTKCPAEVRRSVHKINMWGGNIPRPSNE